MSDFGTSVIVGRRDRTSITEQDRACVDQAIRAVQDAQHRQDANSKPFRFKVIDCHMLGGRRNLSVILSEYWMFDIDEGFNKGRSVEELLEHDRPGAEAVCKALGDELGADYELELVCSDW